MQGSGRGQSLHPGGDGGRLTMGVAVVRGSAADRDLHRRNDRRSSRVLWPYWPSTRDGHRNPEADMNGITESDPVLDEVIALGIDYEVMPSDSANAILVAGKAREGRDRPYALCLVLATQRLDVNGTVRKQLGSRKASFAGAEETIQLTGMQIGGVTPFGLPDKADIPIWVDTAVMARDRIVVGGGSRDRKLLLPPMGLLALPGAKAIEGLARPFPSSEN